MNGFETVQEKMVEDAFTCTKCRCRWFGKDWDAKAKKRGTCKKCHQLRGIPTPWLDDLPDYVDVPDFMRPRSPYNPEGLTDTEQMMIA